MKLINRAIGQKMLHYFLLLGVITIGFLTIVASGSSDDGGAITDDHGNNITEATDLNPGTYLYEISGEIEIENDTDFFSVRIDPYLDVYGIELVPGTLDNGSLHIYDEEGEELLPGIFENMIIQAYNIDGDPAEEGEDIYSIIINFNQVGNTYNTSYYYEVRPLGTSTGTYDLNIDTLIYVGAF